MKVLVYGREILVKRVRENLAGHGIEAAIATSRSVFETAFSVFEKPDLVIIDREAGDAATASRYSRDKFDACTVLMTGSTVKDWEGMDSFAVDGYVSDRFNNGELKARLCAIFRRVQSAMKKAA